MKILITGANGYIGSHVVKSLLDLGHDVIACDLQSNNIDIRAEFICLDILKVVDSCIYKQLKCPDVCLHMAWRDGFIHDSDKHIGDLSSHYLFLKNMIDGGLRHLAVMGSMHEVGYYEGKVDENTPCTPISMYAIAKDALRKCMLLYTKKHNCILQWIRGFYIYGDDLKNHSIFTKLVDANNRGVEKFPFTLGKSKYDFLDVHEFVFQIGAVIQQQRINGTINCCSGIPVSLAEKVEQFIRENKLNIRLDYGAFPDRPYDSPCIYGDREKIDNILKKYEHESEW